MRSAPAVAHWIRFRVPAGAMQPDPPDSSDEGGDPACWAHLFEPDDDIAVNPDHDHEIPAHQIIRPRRVPSRPE